MYTDRDNTLVRRCKQGNRQAMETLIKKYQRPLFNSAYRMLGNPDDAADVTQTTFMNAFRRIQQFNPDYRFFSWIYRIMVNESINTLNSRRHLERLDDQVRDAVAASGGPGPDDHLQLEQVDRQLHNAILALGTDQRTVVILHYISERSYQEIAGILEIPEKTVKSRLYSARQRLKEALEHTPVRPS